MTDFNFLRREQAIAINLKRLYLAYGYSEYKLTSFEEYSLYADNRKFLTGSEVITFNMSGKIFALRPDVTLSVVKNAKEGKTSRVFYDEKVFRRSSSGDFKEMNQLGAELIGEVDFTQEADMISMIGETLKTISTDNVLSLSHMGIIVETLDYMGLNDSEKKLALTYLANKNAHDFEAFCLERGIESGKSSPFKSLINLPHDTAEALKILGKIPLPIKEHVAELELMCAQSLTNTVIDFSVVGDMGYYNGLIFKGFISGVPKAVVYGGRYDKLLERMEKSGGAIGFAVYIGELNKYLQESYIEPDTAIIYSVKSMPKALSLAKKLRSEGKRVLLTKTAQNFKGEIIEVEAGND